MHTHSDFFCTNGDRATYNCLLVAHALIKCCSVTFEREPLCRRQDPSVEDIKLQYGEMDGSWGKVPKTVFDLTSRCMNLHSNLRPRFGGDGGIVDEMKKTLEAF